MMFGVSVDGQSWRAYLSIMSERDMLQIISAVIFANLLTGWWVWSVWKITRNERAGVPADRGPFVFLIGGIVVPMIAALGVYLSDGKPGISNICTATEPPPQASQADQLLQKWSQ